MTTAASLPTVMPTPTVVDADTVFAALGDLIRRRILQGLSDGKARTATALVGSSGKRFDATLKHLVALHKAGLIVSTKDGADGQRRTYSLAPSVLASGGPGGKTMDFGYCLVRY